MKLEAMSEGKKEVRYQCLKYLYFLLNVHHPQMGSPDAKHSSHVSIVSHTSTGCLNNCIWGMQHLLTFFFTRQTQIKHTHAHMYGHTHTHTNKVYFSIDMHQVCTHCVLKCSIREYLCRGGCG